MSSRPSTSPPLLRPVIAIIGATGTGKTAFSIGLAKSLFRSSTDDGSKNHFARQCEIVNADAMQIYRGLDVCTAKITPNEMEGIPHHLFSFINPHSTSDSLSKSIPTFTVHDYVQKACNIIDDIHKRGNIPILVGGTLLYLQAVLWHQSMLSNNCTNPTLPKRKTTDPSCSKTFETSPNSENSPNSPNSQNSENSENSENSQYSYERLQIVDPHIAAKVHPNDKRRIRRYLEIYNITGKPFSASQNAKWFSKPRYRSLIFWIDTERDVLYKRLNQRVKKMVENGLLTECKTFFHQYHLSNPKNDLPLNTTNASMNHPNSPSPPRGGPMQIIGLKELHEYILHSEMKVKVSATINNTKSSCLNSTSKSCLNSTSTESSSKSATTIEEPISLESCLEKISVSTRRYARRQLAWIRNKWIKKANLKLIRVDTTHCVSSVDVAGLVSTLQAGEKCRAFIQGSNALVSYDVVSNNGKEGYENGKEKLKNGQVMMLLPGEGNGHRDPKQSTNDDCIEKEEVWKKYHCVKCNRILNGRHEYQVHLRSRAHRKRKSANHVSSDKLRRQKS